MDHDAAHKYIYSLAEVTADLLRLVVPGWVDELDLSTLEDRSSEYLDDAHQKRLGDMAWRVDFRGGRRTGGAPQVLVLVEFQSEVDRHMAKRMREYAELLLERAARDGTEGREGSLPWVLPIVVYNGSESWTAAGQVSDLASLPSDRAKADLALLQPQAYRLLAAGGALTLGARPAEDWPLSNRVSATVRLQAAGTPQELLPRLLEESVRFPGPPNEAFRQALHSWARALWEDKTGGAAGFPAFEELERTKGAVMATVAEAAWDRWDAKVRAEAFEQGVEQGIEQGIDRGIERGIARGGARLLSRQAALKFGTGTAGRLAGLLRNLTAPEELDRVGDWILECGSGDELLSRVSSLLADRRE